jgi:hypothetical protein
VKTFRNIVVIGLSVLFFFLSTGVMLYQTHCECLGSSNVSLLAAYELSDSSTTDYDCCTTETESANSQTDKIQYPCECDSPVFIYLKLNSHLSENSIFEYSLTKIFSIQSVAVIETVEQLLPERLSVHFTNYAPPNTKKVGRTLVNYLNQYKIALFV